MAKEEGFNEAYLQSVLEDTAAVTGLELIRRIVGLAKVKILLVLRMRKHVLERSEFVLK